MSQLTRRTHRNVAIRPTGSPPYPADLVPQGYGTAHEFRDRDGQLVAEYVVESINEISFALWSAEIDYSTPHRAYLGEIVGTYATREEAVAAMRQHLRDDFRAHVASL